MKILLIYPEFPDTFWSFKYALKLISKKAVFPPLGLVTVAAMLPAQWEKKLVDLNVEALKDEDLKWADYAFISAMAIQRPSAKKVIERCRSLGIKTVAGGPLFTTSFEDFPEVDHLVLGEAECTLAPFLKDLEAGSAARLYQAHEFPDLSGTPVPLWELVKMKKYSTMNVQYSRGCPFDCEFCDIMVLNGRKPRVKEAPQFLRELDKLYRMGWRQGVFVVDDNFIGNKAKLKAETLPALIGWMKSHGFPFSLATEASLNMAEDEELMRLMSAAGFDQVFVGVETPNEESLAECGKKQNEGRDLGAAVRTLLNNGFQVQAGFIVGFDNDPPSIFDRQIKFIQRSGIVTAMVGLLCAPKGTRLYKRMEGEGRLLGEITGDNNDLTNFSPKMGMKNLVEGYSKILATIYANKPFYERVTECLREYRPKARPSGVRRIQPHHFEAFFKSIWFLGIREKGRRNYWRLLLWTLFRRPRSMAVAMTMAAHGLHLQQFARIYVERLNRSVGAVRLKADRVA